MILFLKLNFLSLFDQVNIQCDKVQDLSKALDKVHDSCPYLKPVQPGKVYNMGPILEGISELGAIPKRSLRKTERHDYKKLNSHGKSERR